MCHFWTEVLKAIILSATLPFPLFISMSISLKGAARHTEFQGERETGRGKEIQLTHDVHVTSENNKPFL